MTTMPSPIDFFARLRWIDGRPLLDTIEEYRRDLFVKALHEFGEDGLPAYNFVLAGRAKKNWKSADLVLAALFKLLIAESPHGNDGLIAGNDEDQAAQDLNLAKKLIAANEGELGPELEMMATSIRRKDGGGTLQILPARNVIGQHGKTAIFIGYDEVHGYRTHDLFEALAPDPTRTDVLQWVTTYDTVYNTPGTPLFDLKKIAASGSDARMLFSWYSGNYSTDPRFAFVEDPEVRANPSMASWPEGRAYLEQQKRRLPAHKYRRLHLNLPGVPSGAFLDPDVLAAAVVAKRYTLAPQDGRRYVAFVDMSGGSLDDATLAIAHEIAGHVIIDAVQSQLGPVPFNPRNAVKRFAATMREYGISRVTGDNYAGETFKRDFEDLEIRYVSCPCNKTDLYEHLEPKLNASEVELPDIAKLLDQLQGLVVRGVRVDHLPGEHDDWANAIAGAVWCACHADDVPRASIGQYQFAR